MVSTLESFITHFIDSPTMDVYLFLSLLSGHDKEELMIGPSALLNHMNETPVGDYLEIILKCLQTHFFLPPLFSNTTMGAISVKETIDEGRSHILQFLLHSPSIRSILLESVHWTVVNDESVADIQMNDTSINALVSYAQTYNMVKSSNSTFMIHHLIQSGLVHLYTLSPQFSSNGWSEILPSLYLSPSPIALQAFSSLSEDVNPLLTTQQSILMMPRQSFLHSYYLNQLKSEYQILIQLLSEYHHCFVDSFSVEEWLQGLIELENLSSLFLLHSQMLVRETTDQQG